MMYKEKEQEIGGEKMEWGLIKDNGGNFVARIKNGGNCPKGGEHIIKHQHGENFCKNCGLVFDTDIMPQQDRKTVTIKEGYSI